MPVLARNTEKQAIEDELLKTESFASVSKPVHHNSNFQIKDELLEPGIYEKHAFRLGVYKNKYQNIPITDELITDKFIENASDLVISSKERPDDFFIERGIDLTKTRKIKAKTKYDFTKKQIPVCIKIANCLKSTKNIFEGNMIPFVAQHDFEIKGKKFKKGTTILGRVETISDSDKMGVPEYIKIDNFYIKDREEINLHGSISKTGANRSIWVYPLYQAGNICFYVAGFIFVPIHGGRAKLLTSESFTVFYETP